MALIVQRERGITTSDSMKSKPRQCFTCKERKTGLFTVDANGNPLCSDCHERIRGVPL
ncbi:MAG TPA: hypothetical protein VF960_06045 [Chloroflexota bacterium]